MAARCDDGDERSTAVQVAVWRRKSGVKGEGESDIERERERELHFTNGGGDDDWRLERPAAVHSCRRRR